MKRCPECRRDYYDDTLLYCLDDGNPLLEGPASGSGVGDGPATAILHSTAAPGEAPTRQQINTTGETAIAHTFGEKRSSSLRNIAVGIVLMAMLAAGGFFAFRYLRSEPPQVPRTTKTINTQRLTGDGKVVDAEISPDGKFLVYVRIEGDKDSLWIKQIQTGSTANVVKPGEASKFSGIAFSPDGNYVYFNALMSGNEGQTIYRVPTLGGTPTKFLSNAQLIEFSPDGKQISFRRFDIANVSDTVLVANSDGSNERPLVSRSGKQFYTSSAAWSQDGKNLAVAVGDDDIGVGDINMSLALISVADGSLRDIGSRRWAGIDYVVWHPSGDSVFAVISENYFLPGQLWEMSYPSGEYRKLNNNLNGYGSLSITADGKAIVTGERYSRSAVWVSPDLKPENAKQIMPNTGDTWGFSWTADGRIVYISDQTGDAEVWTMDADGANARQITNDRVAKRVPYASPEGRYIVYSSSKNSGEIVRIDIGGGNPLVLTKALGAYNPHISPDGKWVIYTAYVGGLPKVLRVSIDGGEEQVLTAYPAKEPRYSNDGSRFACFLMDEKSSEWNRLAIIPADGGAPISVIDVPTTTSSARGPVWTPDDKGITLIVAPGEQQNLWLQPVDGGPGKPMTNFTTPGVARRDYSRDGKRIAIVRAEGIGNAIMITDFR